MTISRTLILTALVLAPVALQAAGTDAATPGFVPLTNIPGIEQAGNSATLPDFLNNLYKLCIGLAGILAVLQIIRAGIMYMGGDSITEKKEAKSIITLSISGLILVLSPVIVFSIINPKILDLQIGIEDLRPGSSTSSGTSTTTSTGADTACTAYPDRAAVAAGQSCNTAGGYEPITAACCSGMSSGSTCCGKKATTTPTQAASQWGWRAITVNAQTETQQTTQQRGPFTTKNECEVSLRDWPAANNLAIVEMKCDCTKPLSEQTNCSF